MVRAEPFIENFPPSLPQNCAHGLLRNGAVGSPPHEKGSQVSSQSLTPLASWVSEIKLQSKLDEPGIVRGLRETEGAIGICITVRASRLRRCFIQPMLGSDIGIKATGIVEFRIVMIESIEELCPKLETFLFADGEGLKQRNIPVLGARPLNDVSPRVTKRSDNCVCRKGAGIKQRSRHTWVSVWISDHVGPRWAGDKAATIRRGEVSGDVGGCIPVSRGSDRDARNLPIADDLIPNAGSVSSQWFVLAEGQIVGIAQNESLTDVKIRVPVLQKGVVLEAEVARILRSQAGARSIIQGVAPSVGGLKLQTVGGAFFEANLQRIVVGDVI